MAGEFLERARREAQRYGSDPWVFVRELLQNARDAGARRVAIEAVDRDGGERVSCLDDGSGMTFAHARQYLFALYASSKEADRRAAGRFGVGFWSILRFEPSRIVVRSWPRQGRPWQVELDGALSQVSTSTPPARPASGTEVVVERAGGDGGLARRVRDAAVQSGRFLRCRHDHNRRLDVRVSGEVVSVPFELPPPSTGFRKGRLRGAVALGSEARVELFAQGLRVRSATALEDLLSPDHASALTRVRFPALADGVAPQAILDGEDVEPLLARADVRENRALRRLVGLAQSELRRLIERQIDAVRPPSRRPWWRAAIAAAVVAVAVTGWRWWPQAASPPSMPRATATASLLAAVSVSPEPYRDMGATYLGPRADPPVEHAGTLALRYTPAHAPLGFAALLIEQPRRPPPPVVMQGPYAGPRCERDCVSVSLQVADGPGPLRLPVPTGHRVDAGSVRQGEHALAVQASLADEAVVVLPAPVRGVITYRTGPAAAPTAAVFAPADVPAALAAFARQLRERPAADRVAPATDWVRRHVAYSTAPSVVARHSEALARGRDIVESALEIGAGDCDVQSAVLTVLLQAAGLPARMAVGYVGREGIALLPPHAWVEVREHDGPWQAVDPSAVVAPTPAITPSPPPRERQDTAPWVGFAAALAGALGLLWLLLTRTRRTLRLAPGQSLAALLQGALQRPEAYANVPALYTRPLVPTLAHRPLSLSTASVLASERRLFRSAAGSPLARRAAEGGAVVIDASRLEGQAVGDALGAVDLDEWDTFLRSTRTTPLLLALGHRLRRLGEGWQVRVAARVGPATVLDLPQGGGTVRVVIVDDSETERAQAEAIFSSAPCEALFTAADHLADLLQLSPDDRRRILPPLAREALREAAP